MKVKLIFLLSFALVVAGCQRSVYYNLDDTTPLPEKAVLLLQTTGNDFVGKESLVVLSINGELPESRYSATRIEFKPGTYEFELTLKGGPGIAGGFAAGMAGGTAGLNTHLYGVNRNNPNTLTVKIKMEAGHFYLASYSKSADDKIIVNIEEV
jgi:hypothetical protein